MTGESPLRSRPALIALTVAAVLLVIGVAVVATMAREQPLQTAEVGDTFSGVTRVRVEMDSGAVEVRAGAAGADSASVEGRLRWSTVRRPEFTMTQSGGTLTVKARGCGSIGFRTCQSSAVLTVPPTAELSVHADSGNVTATGLTGPVDLDIDSGNADIEDLGGALSATVDSGNINGVRLSSPRIKVEVDSGNVDLEFAAAPGRVDIDGDSSDLTVRVPEGSGAYSVVAQTDSGRRTVEVPTDATSARHINLTNDSGNVTIGYVNR